MYIIRCLSLPNPEALTLFKSGTLEADPYAFVREVDEDLFPAKTNIDGVFVAGTSSATRDIPRAGRVA